MRRLNIVVSCLVVACACGALAASSAVAALPELGRCVASAGKGAFSRAGCIAVSKKHNGNFEWVSGPGASRSVKEIISGPVLETPKGGKISCTDAQLTGEYTGAKSEKFTKVVVQGCENVIPHTLCYTNPLAPGTIESEVALVGELGPIPGSKLESNPFAGWDLKAENSATPILTFTCGEAKATVAVKLEGSVIGRVTKTNAMVTGFGLSFKQSKGIQAPTAFIGGSEDVLKLAETPLSAETITEQAGLSGGAQLTDGETLEIKAKV